MMPYRIYITFLCCCLFTGTQACHNSRGPQRNGVASGVTDTPAANVAAAPASGAGSAVSATAAQGVGDSPTGSQPAANTVVPSGRQPANSAATSSPTASVSVPSAAGQQSPTVKLSSSDPEEQQFRSFFAVFQKAVRQNNPGQLVNMLYFPLQTAQQWTNQDLRDMAVDKEGGKVSRQEFNSYRENIFNRDVLRLLPDAKEGELSEIDARSPEDYYKLLRKCTDRATKMYEVYMQYPEKNGTAENYFAFVFGRVNGQYKVIGYYAKWPVKG